MMTRLLLLAIATPISAMSFTGQVQTDGSALDVHRAPGVAAPVVGKLQNGSPTTIVCQIRGGTVTGNWGMTDLWDFIGTGYVSDGFVDTGTNGQVAPICDVQGAIPKADSTAEAQRISNSGSGDDRPTADELHGPSELVKAAGKGDLDTVKTLLNRGTDVNQREHCDATPLSAAAKAGHPRVVQALLRAGAKHDFQGRCWMRPRVLCDAVEGGNVDVIGMLLQSGAPANIADPFGKTPLMCASDAGNLEMIKTLLQHGADIHAVESGPNLYPPPLKTALMHAAENGRAEAVQLLLERGSRINDKANGDFTALAFAAGGRDGSGAATDTVRILLKHGADPNVKNRWQITPLMGAVQTGQNETIKVLLEGGANPNDRDAEGKTPLMIAVTRRDPNAVRLLLTKGADLSLKDNQDRTAARLATMLAFPEIERVLIGGDNTAASANAFEPKEEVKPFIAAPRIAKTTWRFVLGERPSGGPWLAGDIVIYRTYGGRIVALAAKTGVKVWETKTDGPYISPPTFDQGTLYFGAETHGLTSSAGQVLALQLANGKQLWSFSTNVPAIADPPLVHGSAIYLHSARDWYAIDRRSGKEIWHLRAESSRTYPAVFSGSTVLLGEDGGRLVAVDAESGRMKWQFVSSNSFSEGEAFLRAAASIARSAEGRTFFTAIGPRQIYPFAIGMCQAVLQGQTETQVMENGREFFGPDVTQALFTTARKTLCPPGTTLEQLSAADRNAQPSTNKETLASRPSIFGNKVFLRTSAGIDSGAIYALDLDSGRVLMHLPTHFSGGSSPVVDDKAVYFMDRNDLMAVAVSSGEKLWSLDLGREHAGYDTLLALAGEHLYAGSYLISRTTGRIEWRMPFNIADPGQNVRDGQLCRLVNQHLAYKVDLATAKVQWTFQVIDLKNAGFRIACDDRRVFYYEDWADYPVYGIELAD